MAPLPARTTAKEKIKTRPDDGSNISGLASAKQYANAFTSTPPGLKPTNDNQPGLTKNARKNATQQSQNEYRNGIVDKTNVVPGAFGKEEQKANPGPELSKGAAANISKEDAKLLDQSQVRNKLRPEDEVGFLSNQNPTQETEEELEPEQPIPQRQSDLSGMPPPEAEDSEQRMLEIISSEMKKHGINISTDEARILRESNFKTKFPWAMASITIMKWFLAADLFFISLGLAAAGVAIKSLYAIPIVGWILGAAGDVTMTTTGLAIFLLGLLSSVVYQVILIIWGVNYGRNAVDFTKRIGIMRKFATRFIIRRSWMLLFGALPLVGEIIDFIMIILFYSHMKRICRKAKDAVEKAQQESGN